MPDVRYRIICTLIGVAEALLECEACGATVLSDDSMATVIATDPDNWHSSTHTEWHRDHG